jgi:hypothetical protein
VVNILGRRASPPARTQAEEADRGYHGDSARAERAAGRQGRLAENGLERPFLRSSRGWRGHRRRDRGFLRGDERLSYLAFTNERSPTARR